jgi:long-chain acyl-CoA synthetase
MRLSALSFSQTTGNPKGAIITHGNIVSAVSAIDERASQEERGDEEVGFSYLPLAHIYERMLQASLVFNAGGIGFSQGDPLKLLEDVQALRPTLFPGVPRVWQRIYDRVHAQVADSGFIKSTLFNKAYTSKLAKLQSGDVGRDGKIASAWDKIIFAKIAALFGGRVKLMSTGAAPLSAKVADFMRVTFMSHFVEGYGMTGQCMGDTACERSILSFVRVKMWCRLLTL